MSLIQTMHERTGIGRELFRVLRAKAQGAQRRSGKPWWSQAFEIARLRRGVGKLDPDEYYQYELYDDRRFTWAQKQEFFGRRMEDGLIPVLREGWWLGLANDKVMTYAFLRGLGFPTPEPYAVYHGARNCGTIPVLRTPGAVAAFARGCSRPFIAKPIFGMAGRDVSAVRRYDAVRDHLVLTNGETMAVDAFAAALDGVRDRGGILLQELLEPHPSIRDVCGNRLCTLRMITLIDDKGPRLLIALWKIATHGSMTDNYCRGANENLVATLDLQTGVVVETSTGVGDAKRFVDRHPDTGRRLPGFALPDWKAAVQLTLDATAAIPRLPMQAWDVALTARGPVLIEVNVNGGMTLPQACLGRGIFHGEFARFLAQFGYPRRIDRGNGRVDAGAPVGHVTRTA